MSQVLAFWLFANSLVLFGLCTWCLVLVRSGPRRRGLIVLALVSGFLGLFTYVTSSSLADVRNEFNLPGMVVSGTLAVCTPMLALLGIRFTRGLERSHA